MWDELLFGAVDGKRGQKEYVEDDTGQEGENEEGCIAPSVVGKLGAEYVLARDYRLWVSVLIASPGTVEKHFELLQITTFITM